MLVEVLVTVALIELRGGFVGTAAGDFDLAAAALRGERSAAASSSLPTPLRR